MVSNCVRIIDIWISGNARVVIEKMGNVGSYISYFSKPAKFIFSALHDALGFDNLAFWSLDHTAQGVLLDCLTYLDTRPFCRIAICARI